MARIKAHFDGRVFVPDEPVALRPGQSVEVETTPSNGTGNHAPSDQLEIARRLLFGSLDVPPLPDEALTREYLYRDDA